MIWNKSCRRPRLPPSVWTSPRPFSRRTARRHAVARLSQEDRPLSAVGFLHVNTALHRCHEGLRGAHHWARELGQLGHAIRLIPPACVKPFVRRHKNDAADAEAIWEAAQRPSICFVLVKSEEQQASGTVVHAGTFELVTGQEAEDEIYLDGFSPSAKARNVAANSSEASK